MKNIILIFFVTLLMACASFKNDANKASLSEFKETQCTENIDSLLKVKVEKTEDEWEKQLSKQEYYVLREKGTDRAFTGEYHDHHEHGTYTCNACGLPLFASNTKFESGTGWPSFYQPLKKECITEYEDNSYGWSRVEVTCGRCDGHLGHVFPDGPRPTNLRYCINSSSLDFCPE